jgi:filamentous hemagglutinin family protein
VRQHFYSPRSLLIALISSTISFNSAVAQVTSDNTVNTQVTQNGDISEITGGETRGSNLFHSFREFSVRTGNEAFFNNAATISNIFSRVTGGNMSNIDGLIRANGAANLYLINPDGIIFGENASLDIGGSFYGSSADSISFPDGEFSATDLDNPPLLTINAPIGFSLRDNPEDIINRSTASTVDEFGFSFPVGLQVNEGESITLEAGNIIFDGGFATAPGGEINLQAIGDIEIIGNNIFDKLLDTSLELGNAGEINLNSSQGNITVTDSTLSTESTLPLDSFEPANTGSGGNITITADKSISITNSIINSTTISRSLEDRGGNVIINAGSSIRLEDARFDVANFGDARSGDITIETPPEGSIKLISTQPQSVDSFDDVSTLSSQAVGVIFVDAFGSGEGLPEEQTGGNLTIQGGSIAIDNYLLISRVNEFSEDFFLPNPNTQGNGGDISITGTSIVIANNSFLAAGTLGEGNAGNINLNANNIVVNNGVRLNTITSSQGAAGAININADSLTLDDSSIEASNIPSQSVSEEVFAGTINLTLTDSLILKNDSQIEARAIDNASGGNIDIGAKFIVALPSQGNGNDIIANAIGGRGGTINISAESIFNIQERRQNTLTNDIDASSDVAGLDGTVSINTPEVNSIQETPELTNNLIDPEQSTANTCDVKQTRQASTFTVKGKGGIPPEITAPLMAEDIHVDGKYNEELTENSLPSQQSLVTQTTDINSPKEQFLTTPDGEPIIPARGIVVRENGDVLLVAYPTPNTMPRSLERKINCDQ